MNDNTPLTEVAAILPTDAAKMLDECVSEVQMAVLAQIRTAVSTLEMCGVALDPVQLALVLDLFVGSLLPYADALYRIGHANSKEPS